MRPEELGKAVNAIESVSRERALPARVGCAHTGRPQYAAARVGAGVRCQVGTAPLSRSCSASLMASPVRPLRWHTNAWHARGDSAYATM